jgi:hypothetical protein
MSQNFDAIIQNSNINEYNTTPNLLNQLKDLWTNDYYDNENLEDFLVNDNDENNLVKENNVDEIESENNDSEIENKSKYLKLELNKLCVEICLSKFTDIEFKKNLISKLFDKEYYNLLQQSNPDFTDLRKFLMYFMDGNFKKQIKMNLYVSMILFRVESEFSNEIFNTLRPRFFKN